MVHKSSGLASGGSSGGGVSSLNSLSGSLTLTSTGATVSITPSGSTIDLEVSGTAAGVSSITNTDGTLTINPGTGNAIASINLGNTNTWIAPIIDSFSPGASQSAILVTGSAYTGGSATTTTPLVYINGSSNAPTTWSTLGTIFGINAQGGGFGNFIDCHANGQASLFSVNSVGTVALSGSLNISRNGAANLPNLFMSGSIFTGGTGTSTQPYIYHNVGVSPTSFSTLGTVLGMNEASGFTGNFLDFHINGGTSLFAITSLGTLQNSGNIITSGLLNSSRTGTISNGALSLTGGWLQSGGTQTTTLPQAYIDASGAAAPTSWATAGTALGINSASTFTGNFEDYHVNGGPSVWTINSNGAAVAGSLGTGFTPVSNALLANSAITIGAQTGLAGGGPVSLGSAITLSMGTGAANTLAGYNNSGVFSDVAIGTNLTLSGGTLNATGSGGGTTLNPYSVGANITASPAAITSSQQLILGTPGYSSSGYNFAQISAASNNFAQFSIQNTTTGNNASTDFVAEADLGTDSAFYVDVGINSSVTGVAPFTNAFAAYLYTASPELDIAAISTGGVINFWTTGGLSPVLAGTIGSNQQWTIPTNGGPSISSLLLSGAAYTAGSGTSNTPLAYLNSSSVAPTTWSIQGTQIGINAQTGFNGNFEDFRVNGGSSVYAVTGGGEIISTGGFSTGGVIATSINGALSQSAVSITGKPVTGGSATTTTPLFYINSGIVPPTTWNTSGTIFGISAPSNYTGNYLDFHSNGGASVFSVTNSGGINMAALGATLGSFTNKISTSYAGSASTPAIQLTGSLFKGGSISTNFPQYYSSNTGATVTSWSTAGTYFGVNANAGFTGNFVDFHTNGGLSLFNVAYTGAVSTAGMVTINPSSGIAQYVAAGAIETAVYSNGSSGTGTFNLNLDNGNHQSITITGAVTLGITTPTHPGSFRIYATQDSTGHSYVYTGIKWPGGAQPTWSSGITNIDVASFAYDGTNTYGVGNTGFA